MIGAENDIIGRKCPHIPSLAITTSPLREIPVPYLRVFPPPHLIDISRQCLLPPTPIILAPSEETIRQDSQPLRRSRCPSQDSAGWNVLRQLPGMENLFLLLHRLALPSIQAGGHRPPLVLVITCLLHLLLLGRIQLPAKDKLLRHPISDTSVLDYKLASHLPLAAEWQFL